MAEGNAPEHLEDMGSCRTLGQPSVSSLELVEDGVVHVLEHQVQTSLAPEELDEVDEILMP